MTAKIDTKPSARSLPGDLADVALIAAPTCAAAGEVSVSWWHEQVKAGRAPAPAVRMPRCTRWRASQVAKFWIEFASKAIDTQSTELLTTKAKKASVKAREPAAVAKAQATRKARIAARNAPTTSPASL